MNRLFLSFMVMNIELLAKGQGSLLQLSPPPPRNLFEWDYGNPEQESPRLDVVYSLKQHSNIPDAVVFCGSPTVCYIISSVLLCCISL